MKLVLLVSYVVCTVRVPTSEPMRVVTCFGGVWCFVLPGAMSARLLERCGRWCRQSRIPWDADITSVDGDEIRVEVNRKIPVTTSISHNFVSSSSAVFPAELESLAIGFHLVVSHFERFNASSSFSRRVRRRQSTLLSNRKQGQIILLFWEEIGGGWRRRWNRPLFWKFNGLFEPGGN